MRILTVGPTGVVAMQRVLSWLADHGDDVWVVDEEETYRGLVPEGFRFTALLLPSEPEVSLAVRLDAAATELRRIADEFRPDLVHLHNVTALGLACVQAGLGPLLVSTWGALAQRAGQTELELPEATRQTLAAADGLIVDAPTLIAPAQALAKPGALVALVPMGADTQRFRPGRTEAALVWRTLFGIPDDAFVLLSPRMWGGFYRHQAILQAYVQAFSRFDRPTRLALVGLGDGPEALPHMAAAWEPVARSAAAGAVRWLPRIGYAEMPTLYAMCDAVISYPEIDSFAATLVEAAACELPVITPLLPTYHGTFVEMACTLVAPGSMEALVEAMASVVNQPAAQRSVVLAEARAIVARDYDDEVTRQRLWSLYSELMKGA